MKKIYFIILDLLCIKFLSSQNLAPNPGFETTSPSCPTASDQLLKAIPWDRGWITPDAFNTCGPTPLTAYTSATGGSQITANTGTGMMGMFCYHSNGNEIEYATVQLASPMLANTQYTVSFYARVANLARFKFTIDRIGCYFTSTSSSSVNYNGGGATPQVQTPAGSYFSTNWTRIFLIKPLKLSGNLASINMRIIPSTCLRKPNGSLSPVGFSPMLNKPTKVSNLSANATQIPT